MLPDATQVTAEPTTKESKVAFGKAVDEATFIETRTLSGVREIHWVNSDGVHGEPVAPGMDLDVVGLGRVRTTKGHFQGTNIGGYYYWPDTQEHVWCESQEEMKALRWFEYEGLFTQAYSQPFAVLFERRADGVKQHTPDFLLVDKAGGYTVVNVRPAERVDDDARLRFDLMAETCRTIGWDYETFTGLAPVREQNLAWLKASRHQRCAPPPDVRERAVSLARGGMPRAALARGLNMKSPTLALPWVDHLLWHRSLHFDLDERLGSATVLSTPEEYKP